MFGFLKKSFKDAVSKITASTYGEEEIKQRINEFEISLLRANVSEGVAKEICNELQQKIKPPIKKKEIEKIMKSAFLGVLDKVLSLPKINLIKEIESKPKPYVILFIGVNGVGKTTTLAKVANYLLTANKTSVFAAADTFRAAAIEQLDFWAKKLKIPIIKHQYKSDPASVAFDAIAYAKAHKKDVVLIDTAGRSDTNTNLIKQLEKIKRVAKPNLTVAVVDALTGNDGINQITIFDKNVGVDALIISKLDADEKGGQIISLADEVKKPILFVGKGQSQQDLEEFSKEEILKQVSNIN